MRIAPALALSLALAAGADPASDGRPFPVSKPHVFIRGRPVGIGSLAFSPDGRWLASGADDGTIAVQDVRTGVLVRTWKAHRDWLDLWFLPDGRRLLSAGTDHRAQVWDAETGELRRTLRTRLGPFALSPDGRRLACSRRSEVEPRGEVLVLNVETGAAEGLLRAGQPEDEVLAVAFSPDGTRLAAIAGLPGPCDEVGGYCTALWMWDLATGRKQASTRITGGAMDQIAFSPGGDLIALAGGTVGAGRVQIWDARSVLRVRSWRFEPDAVYALPFSPEARRLLAGGRFSAVTAWDPGTGRLAHRFPRLGDSVASLAVSPDGRVLAQGGGWRDQGRIALWDLDTFRRVW